MNLILLPNSSNTTLSLSQYLSLSFPSFHTAEKALAAKHEALVLYATLSPPQFLSRTPPRVHHDDEHHHRPSSLFLRLAHSEAVSSYASPPSLSCAVRSSLTPSLLFCLHPTRRHRRLPSRRRSHRGSHCRSLRPCLHLRSPHPAKPHSTGSNFFFFFFFLDKISSYLHIF
jgi:hypothetical protein